MKRPRWHFWFPLMLKISINHKHVVCERCLQRQDTLQKEQLVFNSLYSHKQLISAIQAVKKCKHCEHQQWQH